jgi:hypothetical protein
MNPFVFACITPHGGEIIPALSGHDSARMGKTIRDVVQASNKRIGIIEQPPQHTSNEPC